MFQCQPWASPRQCRTFFRWHDEVDNNGVDMRAVILLSRPIQMELSIERPQQLCCHQLRYYQLRCYHAVTIISGRRGARGLRRSENLQEKERSRGIGTFTRRSRRRSRRWAWRARLGARWALVGGAQLEHIRWLAGLLGTTYDYDRARACSALCAPLETPTARAACELRCVREPFARGLYPGNSTPYQKELPLLN
jgi:hypothetical protein